METNHVTQAPHVMSSETAALFEALAKAHSELTNPTRNAHVTVRMKNGGTYNFKYATLDSILDLARPILARHGLAIVQSLNTDGQKIRLDTYITHASGQWIKAQAPINPVEDGIKELGSAITYIRRYSLTALLGLCADEDDDGSAAHGHQSTQAPRSGNQAPKPSTPPPAQPASKGDQATQAQQKALFGLGKALGLAGKDDLLKALNGWLAREIPDRAAISSTSELTKAEASRIIESMKAKVSTQGGQTGTEQAPDPGSQHEPEAPAGW